MMSLLEKVYTQKNLNEVNQGDYINLLSDMELFSIKPQIFHQLKTHQQNDCLSRFLINNVKGSYEKASYQNLILRHHLDLLLNLFDQGKVSVIPLKGVIFSELYFGNFAARGTADIDLLISPSDLQQALKIIVGAGFVIEEDEGPTSNHCSLVKRNSNSSFSITVELHWNLDKEYYSNLSQEAFWKNSIRYLNYSYVRVLSIQDTFYYSCLHAVRHKMNSIKYFIDLIQVLLKYSNQIDYREIKERAKADKTWKKVNVCLSILYRELPFLESIKPYPYKKESFLNWSLGNARKAQTHQKDLSYFIYKFYFNYCLFDSPKHLIMSTKFFHYIYPPKTYLEYFLGEEKQPNSRLLLLKQYYRTLLQQHSLKYHKA